MITKLPLHTYFRSYLFVVVLLPVLCLFVSCDERIEEYKLDEQPPGYLEPATIMLGELRAAGELDRYKYILDSISAANRDKGITDLFYVWYLYADSYNRIGEDSLADLYTDSAIQLIEDNSPSYFYRDNYLWAYYFKADNQLRAGRLDEAYSYYYQALSSAEKFNDECAIGYYHLKIGLLMFDAYQYRDALRYFTQAYNKCLTCKETFGYFYRTQELLNDIGLCYERLGMYDSAIYTYNKGIELILNKKDSYASKWNGLKVSAVSIFKGNLGSTYLDAGYPDKAERVLKESLAPIEYHNSSPYDAAFTRVKLARVYASTERPGKAMELLKDVQEKGFTQNSQSIRARWFRVLAMCYESRGDINNAYKYFKIYKACEDSVRRVNTSFSLASLDNKVKSIGSKYKIAALEQTAETRKTYLVTFIVLAILALIIIVLIINNLRRSRRHVQVLTSMNKKIKDQQHKLKSVLKDLENADSEKDRILKAVSHDMRSPINSVLALIDLLSADSSKYDEEQKEYISLIQKSGNNALNLTKDLLEVATLKSEKLEKAPVDITSEIDARIKLLQFKASEKDQQIIFNAPANHITANVNEEKLLRVIGNLVNNAIKFSPTGSNIYVSLSSTGSAFQVEVKDSGIGIPAAMKEKVFDLFSEAKRFGTSGEQPFGLGLSISKQIVEAHDGRIWFESVEGQGTTFFVEMPL